MNRTQKLITLACCWLAFVALPGVAFAQDDDPEEEPVFDLFRSTGVTELQLQGSLGLATDDDATNFGQVEAIYGWFFTENQEVGGRAKLRIFDDRDGDLDFSGVVGPFYRYNFLSGEIVPYVGAALEASFGDAFTGDVLLEVEGGSRFFLDRNTAFTVAASVYYDVDASELSDVLNVFFGFSHFWQ